MKYKCTDFGSYCPVFSFLRSVFYSTTAQIRFHPKRPYYHKNEWQHQGKDLYSRLL